MFRATEMFKIVTAAFESYKAAEERAASTAAPAAAPVPSASGTRGGARGGAAGGATHTPFYGTKRR